MINLLRDQLIAATGPSRELDCDLHETILGQFDERPDGKWRKVSRQNGFILVDLGSERREMRVPCYTENADIAASLLPGLGLRISYQTADVIKVAGVIGDTFLTKAWALTATIPAECRIVAQASHDKSLALALCLLAVVHRMDK